MVGNDNPVRVYINNIFSKYESNVDSIQLKEEIIGNLNDKINDYSQKGLSFTDAFEKAKTELGDIDTMLKDMFGIKNYKILEKNNKNKIHISNNSYYKHLWNNKQNMVLPLLPFIYILTGFAFNLWHITWVIIPIGGIWMSNCSLRSKIISTTPFIYVMMGFLFDAWAIGWIIIPLSAIFLSATTD